MAGNSISDQPASASDTGTPERVAFDMAKQIVAYEFVEKRRHPTRTEFLGLYAECLKAVRGVR